MPRPPSALAPGAGAGAGRRNPPRAVTRPRTRARGLGLLLQVPALLLLLLGLLGPNLARAQLNATELAETVASGAIGDALAAILEGAGVDLAAALPEEEEEEPSSSSSADDDDLPLLAAGRGAGAAIEGCFAAAGEGAVQAPGLGKKKVTVPACADKCRPGDTSGLAANYFALQNGNRCFCLAAPPAAAAVPEAACRAKACRGNPEYACGGREAALVYRYADAGELEGEGDATPAAEAAPLCADNVGAPCAALAAEGLCAPPGAGATAEALVVHANVLRDCKQSCGVCDGTAAAAQPLRPLLPTPAPAADEQTEGDDSKGAPPGCADSPDYPCAALTAESLAGCADALLQRECPASCAVPRCLPDAAGGVAGSVETDRGPGAGVRPDGGDVAEGAFELLEQPPPWNLQALPTNFPGILEFQLAYCHLIEPAFRFTLRCEPPAGGNATVEARVDVKDCDSRRFNFLVEGFDPAAPLHAVVDPPADEADLAFTCSATATGLLGESAPSRPIYLAKGLQAWEVPEADDGPGFCALSEDRFAGFKAPFHVGVHSAPTADSLAVRWDYCGPLGGDLWASAYAVACRVVTTQNLFFEGSANSTEAAVLLPTVLNGGLKPGCWDTQMMLELEGALPGVPYECQITAVHGTGEGFDVGNLVSAPSAKAYPIAGWAMLDAAVATQSTRPAPACGAPPPDLQTFNGSTTSG